MRIGFVSDAVIDDAGSIYGRDIPLREGVLRYRAPQSLLPDSFTSPGLEPPKLTKWRRAQELREYQWQEEKRDAERNGTSTGIRIEQDAGLREALRLSVSESYLSFEQRRDAEHVLADYIRRGLETDFGLLLPLDERTSLMEQAQTFSTRLIRAILCFTAFMLVMRNDF